MTDCAPLALEKAPCEKTLRAELLPLCEEVRFHEPLGRFTTFGCGGPALVFAMPRNGEQVVKLLAAAQRLGLPSMILGGGSNMLISDQGYLGLIVHTRGLRGQTVLSNSPPVIEVAAGEPTTALLQKASLLGWQGLEFLAGLPGTIGGGIRMNAGTPQGDFKQVTDCVTIASARGIETWPKEKAGFVYRGSAIAQDSCVISVRLCPGQCSPEAFRERAEAQKQHRKKTQPYGTRCAGSVFKNPAGDYAGRLIDALSLKGAFLGKAQVSEMHANFIVAKAGARALDIYQLAHYLRTQVFRHFGVELDFEVRLVGPFPSPETFEPNWGVSLP